MDNENILSRYIINDYKYFNNEKRVFQTIENENIKVDEKLILEIHIYEKKNIFCTNLKWIKKYIENEIIKIKNKVNKLSDISKKYDLIYLYASPIIPNGNSEESPIKYMEEIRIILELMKNNKKRFNCKFECMNENILEDVIINNKTKILHISSHGILDENYSLMVENLNKNGQRQFIDYNKLEMILKTGKININKIDLVIVSTCYSEDFGKLFLKYGVRNVIYIDKKTELIDDLSVFFVKYFYRNLLENKNIKDSYDDAIKSMRNDEEIIKINKEACCCNHWHKKECILKNSKKKEDFHNNIHLIILDKCKCNNEQSNYHDKNCEYYKLIKDNLSNNKTTDIIEENNKIKICCCDNNIEHNEISKIRYEHKENSSYIKLFKYNINGELFINSAIRFYYDNKKFIFTRGRRTLIGKIFNKIMNNENYVIFYGEKDLLKTDFAESLCVYLYERKIINNYEIFRINSEFDFIYIKNKIREYIQKNNNINIKNKKVEIIKFDLKNNEKNKSFEYLYKIYEEFCCMNNSNIYFIFIFDTISESNLNLQDNINKAINLNDNIFDLGIDIYYSLKILNDLIRGKNVEISYDEKYELLKANDNYKPKKIKLISDLLINGETFENIKNKENLELDNIELNKNKLSFPLYYLLLNMPSGLPKSFLELIFDNYKEINDDKNIIHQKISNNWSYIKKDKRFEESFKEDKYMDICYKHIFKTLKLYAKILIFFIERNKEKINYKNGDIHYLFNSYSNRNIWKSRIYNSIEKQIGDKIISFDFKLENHKFNILNLISLIVNNIKVFRELQEWSDDYLEEILLLFPSFFFLEKDNLKILQICIDLCKKLIKTTNEENLKNGEEYLKQKLLLFLYSIDENKNEILNINNINNKDLKLEIDFLRYIRNKDKKIENLVNLSSNASNEMKLYIYREIAIIHLKNKNYNECMEHLKEILNLENLENIRRNRINLDYSYTFMKKLINDNNQKININENYNLIKKQIMTLNYIIKKPYQKDIFKEAFILRDKINDDLLEPDIIMLNSNPLKTISNKVFTLNNQYYILRKLKKDINEHIRIKSYVLNNENLLKAINNKGKILIIQSDDFTENGDIVCESKKGKSEIIDLNTIENIIKIKEINYKVIILCFPNSYKIKQYFDNYPYIISFENVNNLSMKGNMLEELNKASIEFIIDFIKNITNETLNNEIKNIFELSKNKFLENIKSIKNEINCKDYIILSDKSSVDSKIKYLKDIDDKELFLYEPLIKFNNINIKEDEDIQKYAFQIYYAIKKIKNENKVIFYSDETTKMKYLKICFEVMKFYYRHKTYNELFCIDIKQGGKTLLKSIIRKFNEFKNKINNKKI